MIFLKINNFLNNFGLMSTVLSILSALQLLTVNPLIPMTAIGEMVKREYYNGYNRIWDNIGATQNKGIEFNIEGTIMKTPVL